MSNVNPTPQSVNPLAGQLHSLFIDPEDRHFARYFVAVSPTACKTEQAEVTADEFYALLSANYSRLDYQEPGYYSFDCRAAEEDALAAALFAQTAQMEVAIL